MKMNSVIDLIIDEFNRVNVDKSLPAGESLVSDSNSVIKKLTQISIPSCRINSPTTLKHLINVDKNLYIKLETLNRTGSFKDRAFAITKEYLSTQKPKRLYLESSGNAAASMISYLSSNAIGSRLILTANYRKMVPPNNINNLEILRNESGQNLFYQLIGFGFSILSNWDRYWNLKNYSYFANLLRQNYYLCQPSLFVNALSVLGYAVISLEIVDQLKSAPDWIFTPTINSDNAIGQWMGYHWLKNAGLIDKIPSLVLVTNKQRISHWNMYSAWKQIKRLSSVYLHGADSNQGILGQKKLKNLGVRSSVLSAKTFIAYTSFKERGVIKEEEVCVLINSGRFSENV